MTWERLFENGNDDGNGNRYENRTPDKKRIMLLEGKYDNEYN